MKYQVVHDKVKREVQALADGATVPAGFTKLEDITHPDTDVLGAAVNHVLYQHVQDVLYRKLNEQDMQRLKMTWPGKVLATGLTASPANLNTAKAGTEVTVTVTAAPAAAVVENLDVQIFNGKSGKSFVRLVKRRGNVYTFACVRPGESSIRFTDQTTGLYVIVPVKVS